LLELVESSAVQIADSTLDELSLILDFYKLPSEASAKAIESGTTKDHKLTTADKKFTKKLATLLKLDESQSFQLLKSYVASQVLLKSQGSLVC
jgi:hypothetical protein